MFSVFDERQALRENTRNANMPSGTLGLSERYALHIRDVMDFLFEVWNSIMSTIVTNSWG
jgi:hypothetical protein